MGKVWLIVVLVQAVLALLSRGEFIFRGQCSSFFQPQEVAITVDTSDVVFYRYVIPPANKPVPGQQHCESDCLATRKPPCRTAIYDPSQSTCWLLRADKSTALEFDTLNPVSPLSGLLIAPQNLVDGANDRIFGVANCSGYCPTPQVQSADNVSPVCIQDCPSSAPVCAGEMANCMDISRRVTLVQGPVAWAIYVGSGFPYILSSISFNKKYDYTSFRVTVQLASWIVNPTSTSSLQTEHYIYPNIANYFSCTGEANIFHSMSRQMAEGYNNNGEWGESSHGEFSCTYYDIPTGSYQLQMIYDYRYWSPTFGSRGAPGTTLLGTTSPWMIHVEEYIPSAKSGYFKLDDMARCQSATMFNSYTTQWPSINHLNIVGRTDFVVWKYKKRSDTSTLRIMWSGQVWVDVNQKCLHLYFTINDQLCSNPNSIETSHRDWMYNTGAARPAPNAHTTSLDGICRGLPAGRYDIALWVDFACPYYDSVSSYNSYNIGYSRPAYYIVEEINENLPINALLMSDGTMMNLPYYNRQYFVWNTGGCQLVINNTNQCFYPYIKQFVYNKLQASSALHVKWYGTQAQCPQNNIYSETARWYIQFNGAECGSNRIESWWYDGGQQGGYCKTRPKYVEGVCKTSMAPGPVTLTLMLGQAVAGWGSWSGNNVLYGHTAGGTSYLMVEELYDGNI